MRMRTHFIPVCSALLMVGCGLNLPRLNATSVAELKSSLQQYVEDGDGKTRDSRSAEAELLLREYVAGDGFKKVPANYPPLVALHQLRHEDVSEFVKRLKKVRDDATSPLMPETQNPSEPVHLRWLNESILAQLKVQKSVLELNRERARYKDLFTVDQLLYREAAFIPPQEGVPYGSDHAVFTIKFTNESFFNIYTLGFRVRVKEPAYTLPLIDDVLFYDATKEPIKVGETRMIELKCCDSISSEILNLSLRNLSTNASIDIDLANVTDFTKTDRLNGTFFDSEQNVKLVATGVCIKDMEERMASWTWSDADPACIKY